MPPISWLMKHVVILLLLLATGLMPALAGPPDDFQYRSRIDLRWLNTDHFTLNTFAEVRLTDSASRLTNYRVSQQAQYHPWRELTVGVGYAFIDQDGLDPITQKISHAQAHRAEFDFIPHIKLSDDVTLNWRARFENRWIEHRGSYNPQFRTRPELVFALHHAGPLKEIFASEEYFYDLRTGRSAENRLVPAGLTFALTDHTRLKVYYLLDSVHSGPDWVSVHVLQTQLQISFR